MSYRSNESCVPKQQRKQYMSTVGARMSDKNLEQRTNIKFYVKIGRSASETLSLLTLTYGEYGKKKSSDFECIGSSRKGKKT
jgi:hypothetical protein